MTLQFSRLAHILSTILLSVVLSATILVAFLHLTFQAHHEELVKDHILVMSDVGRVPQSEWQIRNINRGVCNNTNEEPM